MPATATMTPSATAEQRAVIVTGTEPAMVALPTLATRVSGQTWKVAKKPIRAQLHPGLRQPWAKRMRERGVVDAAKRREVELKAERDEVKQAKDTEKERRRVLQEEKDRMERLQAVLSAKKLQRLKRKESKQKAMMKKKPST